MPTDNSKSNRGKQRKSSYNRRGDKYPNMTAEQRGMDELSRYTQQLSEGAKNDAQMRMNRYKAMKDAIKNRRTKSRKGDNR